MAEKRVEYFKLYNPDNGTEVEVAGKERAEVLKGRGFTEKKARSYSGPNSAKRSDGRDESAEVADLKAQLEKAKQERDEALQAATTPK